MSNKSPELIHHFLHLRTALRVFVPATTNQVLQLCPDLFWQLGSEVLLSKPGDDFFEGQLPVLPVLRNHLVKHDPERVDVCRLLGLQDHVVFVPEVLNCCVHALVSVPRYQGKVLPERVQPATIEHHSLLLQEGVAGRNAPVHDVVRVQLDHCLPQLDRQLEQLGLPPPALSTASSSPSE